MTAPNHLVGGFTFTGIFGSLLGINILSDHRLLPIIFIASLLPDIDHSKSLIGKVFLPISKILNKRYGHRTITHSLVAVIVLTGFLSVIQNALFPSIKVYQVFGLAYSSHLLLDMITVQGIPLFYPFKKNACVIPGRADLRFRSGNVQHEAIGLCMFGVSAVFMQPLFADGFWTSYNRLFGTMTHLVSEYHKSPDLLEISFQIQHGSTVSTKKGYCISASENKLTILDEQQQFMTYPQDGQFIYNIYPEHTSLKYEFKSGQFYNISLDSLYCLFAHGKYRQFTLQGNHNFIHINNNLEHSVSYLELEFPNEIHLKEILHKNKSNYIVSPTVRTKEHQILRLEENYKVKMDIYQRELAAYEAMRLGTETAENNIEKEVLMIRFAKMKRPSPPDDIAFKIALLESEIESIRQADYHKYQLDKLNNASEDLYFSGSYEMLIISDYSDSKESTAYE